MASNQHIKDQLNRLKDYEGGVAGMQEQAKGLYDDSPRIPTLIDRLEKQMYHVKQEANKFQALTELNQLLRENPVIARILDLLDMVGVR